MLSFNALVLICLVYVVFLFVVAFAVERVGHKGNADVA